MKKSIFLMLTFFSSLAFSETNIYKSFILHNNNFKNIEIGSGDEDSTPINNGGDSNSPNTSKESVTATINITTDNYPDETSFKITNLDTSNVIHNQNYNSDNINSNITTNVVINNTGNYLFEILDGYGDGICCIEGNGDYSFDIDSTHINDGGEYQYGEYTFFTINDDFSVTIGDTGFYTDSTHTLPTNLSVPFNYNIITDENPEQTFFDLYNVTDDVIFLTGPTFPSLGRSLEIHDHINITKPATYIFSVYDSAGNGMGSGSYSIYADTVLLNDGSSIQYGEWTKFSVDSFGNVNIIDTGFYATEEDANNRNTETNDGSGDNGSGDNPYNNNYYSFYSYINNNYITKDMPNKITISNFSSTTDYLDKRYSLIANKLPKQTYFYYEVEVDLTNVNDPNIGYTRDFETVKFSAFGRDILFFHNTWENDGVGDWISIYPDGSWKTTEFVYSAGKVVRLGFLVDTENALITLYSDIDPSIPRGTFSATSLEMAALYTDGFVNSLDGRTVASKILFDKNLWILSPENSPVSISEATYP